MIPAPELDAIYCGQHDLYDRTWCGQHGEVDHCAVGLRNMHEAGVGYREAPELDDVEVRQWDPVRWIEARYLDPGHVTDCPCALCSGDAA